jgi:DNA-binding transcriptional LysR family regulator
VLGPAGVPAENVGEGVDHGGAAGEGVGEAFGLVSCLRGDDIERLAGFEPQIAFQNDDYPAMLGFVAAGVGVALIPDMVTRGIRDDVVVRALDPPPPARPILAALPGGYRSPAAAAMLTVLHEISETWTATRQTFVSRGRETAGSRP